MQGLSLLQTPTPPRNSSLSMFAARGGDEIGDVEISVLPEVCQYIFAVGPKESPPNGGKSCPAALIFSKANHSFNRIDSYS